MQRSAIPPLRLRVTEISWKLVSHAASSLAEIKGNVRLHTGVAKLGEATE